jgi:hypothetical protein
MIRLNKKRCCLTLLVKRNAGDSYSLSRDSYPIVGVTVVSSWIYRATQDTLVVVGITCGLGSVVYCRHTGCISL